MKKSRHNGNLKKKHKLDKGVEKNLELVEKFVNIGFPCPDYYIGCTLVVVY